MLVVASFERSRRNGLSPLCARLTSGTDPARVNRGSRPVPHGAQTESESDIRTEELPSHADGSTTMAYTYVRNREREHRA